MTRIQAAIALFPKVFGLRAFRGDVFCLSEAASYVNDYDEVILYTRRLVDGEWLDFAKGTIHELTRQVTP